MMREFRRLSPVLILAALQHAATSACAQEFPSKPIRIVSVGGPDISARIIGKQFTELMGQPVVSENIAGAGGKIAAETVAKARPDGYTILNGVTSLMIVSAVQKDTPDMSRDFAAVALTNRLPYVLVINPALPAKSVQQFIALARSQPGKMNYTGANATLAHLAFELFDSMARIDIIHVPMNTAQQAAAIMSGQVDAVMAPAAQMVELGKSGRVRIIAVTTAKRSPLLPDVPTLAESGLNGYSLDGWNGFLVPLNTPPAVIRRLNEAVRQALRKPEVVSQLAAIAYEPGDDFSPQEFGDFLKLEAAKWKKLTDDVGVKID